MTSEPQEAPPFTKGDIVETIKGAKFWGRVTSVYDIRPGEWRVDVVAIDPGFEDTLHVYPAKQLRIRAMTDINALVESIRQRVANGDCDLRDVGQLLFGNWDQDSVAKLIAAAAGYDHLSDGKPGGTIAKIVQLAPPGSEVTVAHLRRLIAERGIEATPKEIYNALTYLSRTGRLRRVGYGRYIVQGVATTEKS